jgi:ribosomal protein L22
MKMFSLNFGKRLTFAKNFPSLKFSSPMFNLKNFSTENQQDVNFAFHNSTKPKLRIKTTPMVSPINFMAQKDVPFFVLKESSFKKRDKKSKPTIATGDLKYSSYKLNDVCKLIRGKYIRTALDILELNNTKGAKLIKKELSEYLEKRDKQIKKEHERIIQKKTERENEEKRSLNDRQNSVQEDHSSPQNESFGDKIMLENNTENSDESNFNEEIETEITEKKSENLDYLPYYDFKITEIYVGRKVGPAVPSPRAKGKVDRIYRSISKLYVHIEKVPAEKFFQSVAIGKADFSFARTYRKSLFMNNASIKLLKSFSFITTSRGRYYRKIQFDRLVTHLRDKYYKEKGIKLNTEIIREQLKIQLGKEMAQINPNNLKYLLSSSKDSISRKINEKVVEKLGIGEDKQDEEIKDKSYRAREEEFNKNYKKIE